MFNMKPENQATQLDRKIEKTRTYFNKKKPSGSDHFNPISDFVYRKISGIIPEGTRGQKAVDLGCHWGRYTKILSESYGQVVGIDYAEKALESAYVSENIEYRLMDLDGNSDKLLEYAPVDFYLSVALFEMLKNPLTLCENINLSMSVSGKLLVIILNRFSVNYLSLRLYMLLARVIKGKKMFIYNNGISKKKLIAFLKSSGLSVINHGSIVGVPVYLISKLPNIIQSFLIFFDAGIKILFGGSYIWVMAKKAIGHENCHND